MPYIVTASRPLPKRLIPETILVAFEVTYRRAVSTLAEARTEAAGIVDEFHSVDEHFFATAAIPESGGTVGPLPDGTLIEVEQRKRSALYRELPTIVRARFGSWANMTDEQVCSAWNANYAREAG